MRIGIKKDDHMFNLGDIIDLAVRLEKNGENTYRKAMKEVTDPSISSVLNQLAADELEHVKWFEDLRERVESTGIAPELDEMGKMMLQNILGDQAFSISEADFFKIDNIKELLELSIEFEKDTILFYEMILAVIEDEKTIESLNAIIEEENRHVRVLAESLEGGISPTRS
jgi:rubrerythrin